MSQNMSIVIGLCCYNSSQGLPRIFKNLRELSTKFKSTVAIFCYDISRDNTLELIKNEFQRNAPCVAELVANRYPRTHSRTHNISNARNTVLDVIKERYAHFELLSMMDCNEYACIGDIELETLDDILRDDMIDRWDGISFNREAGYYDYWALSFSPFVYSFFHCTGWQQVVAAMRERFSKILDEEKGELIYVYSAFNGFAIYKMSKFVDCRYSDKISVELFPAGEIAKQCLAAKCNIIDSLSDDCEHRNFHLESIKNTTAKLPFTTRVSLKRYIRRFLI